MTIKNYTIYSEEKTLGFSFLQQNDFLKTLNVKRELYGSSLNNIIKINSDKSGQLLTQDNLFDLSALFTGKIYQESKQNSSLLIKNDNISLYFYTLSEITHEKNKIKILYFWEIESTLISPSLKLFCLNHSLDYRNCCWRNCLIQFQDNFDLYVKTSKDLDQFCSFPPKFIDGNCIYYGHLLNPQIQKNNFDKLDINKKFITTDNYFPSTRPYRPQFLRGSRLKQMVDMKSRVKKLANSYSIPNLEELVNIPEPLNITPAIAKKLDYLDDNSLKNYNCKDLKESVSFKNGNLEQFVFDSLITCYLYQKGLCLDCPEIKLDIKLLFCQFFF